MPATAPDARPVILTAPQLTETMLRHAGHDPRHHITLTAVGSSVALAPVTVIDPHGMTAARADITLTVAQLRAIAGWAQQHGRRSVSVHNDNTDIIISDTVTDLACVTAEGTVR